MGMFNIYDEQAKTQASPQETGMAYAKLSPGRGSVALAGQAGQMMSQGAMGAMGMKTPAQKRQANITKVRQQFPNPQTSTDYQALASALRNIGEWDMAEKAIKSYKDSSSAEAYTKQVELQNVSIQMKQEEREAQKRVPKLGNAWDKNEKDKEVAYWLQTNIDDVTSEDLENMTLARAKILLRKKYKGGAGTLIKTLEAELKKLRDNHIFNNKFNPSAIVEDAKYSDASTLFGGEAAKSKPNLDDIPPPPATSVKEPVIIGYRDNPNPRGKGTQIPIYETVPTYPNNPRINRESSTYPTKQNFNPRANR